MKRKTNTGGLVPAVLSSEQCIVLEWNGRDDNERVEAELQSLRTGKSAVLLWTDRHDVDDDYNSFEIREGEKSLYIVIDTTWQEAKTIFRRGPPILRSLIHLSLRKERESCYLLRKDYGYKKKFGERGLMCTAEVCAALMKREGLIEQAQSLYQLLDELQRVHGR
jgi:DTW domain-containing protein YfiP